MNREIKFRAWSTEYKAMVYPDYITHDGEVHSLGKEHASGLYKPHKVEHEVILMQYTGLKDKNGKEIYEGDLLVVLDLYNGKPAQECAAVVFSHEYDGGWVATSDGLNRLNVGTRTQFVEVIGNIYENPELVQLTLKQS